METKATEQFEISEVPACQNCKYWTRKMNHAPSYSGINNPMLWPPRPTPYGVCKSKEVSRASYVESSSVELDDLDTDLYTRQDFGCVFYAKAGS
ncbi:hypothetical protein ACFFMH_09150 [Rufibacter immobilis]